MNLNKYSLIDDGSLDTCIGYEIQAEPGQHAETVTVRYSQDEAAPYRDTKTGALDFDRFVMDHHEDIAECAAMQIA